MKVVKKNVYYCDFCKKRSLRSLKKHEKHCTGNPDRYCQLCGRPDGIREIGDKLRAKFRVTPLNNWAESEKVEWIQEFQLEDVRTEIEQYDEGCCPNCLLAVIRAAGLNRYYFEKRFNFDYKKELDEWWACHNEANDGDPYEHY